ncbi:hypothetical protein ABBQ32_003043 [Trebouxia sp. C0010 RCD-2024]
MAGVDFASSQLDPYVKPKPGKKPKAALPDSLAASSRPLSANSQSTGRTGFPPPAEKQNLVSCKYFEQGECQRGSGCWFAHGRDELRNPHKHASRQQAHAPKQHQHQHQQQNHVLNEDEQCPDEALFKTRMCVYYMQGRCQRGKSCTFAHDPSELQAYDPARRYTHQAQSSPAHTMDRFLPQKLQEAAAAATAAKARAAGTAAKPEPQQAKFVAAKADKNKERAAGPPSRPSPVASPTKPFKEPIATAPVSRPYITPMPAGIKPRRAILQQDEGANGIMGQVLSKGNNPTPGIIDEFGQVEQGMEFLNMDAPLPDDLDAPSSFCCPITTELLHDPVVAADGHTYERQHITEWLQKSSTSPMTNERMEHKHLIPNRVLREVMDAYFAHRTEAVQ